MIGLRRRPSVPGLHRPHTKRRSAITTSARSCGSARRAVASPQRRCSCIFTNRFAGPTTATQILVSAHRRDLNANLGQRLTAPSAKAPTGWGQPPSVAAKSVRTQSAHVWSMKVSRRFTHCSDESNARARSRYRVRPSCCKRRTEHDHCVELVRMRIAWPDGVTLLCPQRQFLTAAYRAQPPLHATERCSANAGPNPAIPSIAANLSSNSPDSASCRGRDQRGRSNVPAV